LHRNHTSAEFVAFNSITLITPTGCAIRATFEASGGGFMQRCHACNRQFGLIRHRWWGYHFCTKKCLNDFLAKRSQQIGRMKDWLSSSEAPAREPSRL
jgi:hypothetical protein